METDGHVEKQSTVFPHVLAKRLGAFCTVPTGFTAVNPQTTKPDISLATKTGHFYLLPTRMKDRRRVCATEAAVQTAATEKPELLFPHLCPIA